MCWNNTFWFCWCAFFWTLSRAVLDEQQKHVQSITKFDCTRKSRSETENSTSETHFLSFTPPCPCRKGKQLAQWFAARGGKAVHAEPSLLSVHEKRHFCTRSLLHAVQEGEVSREPAAWGPQLHTQAHSASFSPVPSSFSHTTAVHKCLFDLHWGKILWPLIKQIQHFQQREAFLSHHHSFLVLWEFT